mgnify:CR=1 FL=1
MHFFSELVGEGGTYVARGVAVRDGIAYGVQWDLPTGAVKILAWDTTTGSTSVIIAICDTGVDPNHADLKNSLVAGYNFYDNNTTTTDVHGHGTQVAGAAAAIGNNSSAANAVASPIMSPCQSPSGDQ